MPSWKISVLSQAAEPGSRPPTSPWCAVVVAKPISVPSRNTGRNTKMSCRWMPPSNGSFITKTSPGLHPVAPLRAQRVERVRHGAQVEGNGHRLRDRLAVRVAERGREVHPVAHDGRVRGAEDRRRHLVRDRGERVADDLLRDRVDACGRSRERLQDERLGGGVAPRRPARADDDGRVVLVDQQRPRRRRSPIEARVRTGRSPRTVSRMARGRLERRPGATSRSTALRRPERREPQRADLDRRPGLAAHAVEPLVLVLERRRRARACRPDRRRRPRSPTSARRSGAPRSARARPRRGSTESSRPSSSKIASSSRGSTARASRWHGAHLVELGPREEQAERAEEAGERGDEHGPAAEVLGEPGRVHRAGAAVGDQGEVARVAALLGRHRPQRAHHPRVRDRVDPGGELGRGHVELGGERLERACRPASRSTSISPSARGPSGTKPRKTFASVTVGCVAAAAVAGRPGVGARASAVRPGGPPPCRARRSSRRPRRPPRCRSSGCGAARRSRA